MQTELISEIQMLRNLASLGIGVGVFGHETESAIKTIGDALVLLEEDPTNDETANLVETMTSSVATLRSYSDLITEYLRAPKRELRVVNVNHIVRRLMKRFEYLFDEYKVEVTLSLAEPLPLLSVRPIDIEAVLINLITNAVHFMGQSKARKRKISVETSADDGWIELCFADTGPGIPSRLGSDVFLPFETTKEDGTGLGLTIVRDTVESYRGSIALSDHKLGGAAFTIRLPSRKST
jgi:signal transduction histidine kinase